MGCAGACPSNVNAKLHPCLHSQVCASGMKAAQLAALSIGAGAACARACVCMCSVHVCLCRVCVGERGSGAACVCVTVCCVCVCVEGIVIRAIRTQLHRTEQRIK